MKNFKFLFLLVLLLNYSGVERLYGQIIVPTRDTKYEAFSSVAEEQYKALLKKTLVFLYTPYDKDAETYKAALEQAWPNGHVQLVPVADLKKWEEKDGVAFVGFEKHTCTNRVFCTNTWALWSTEADKHGKRERIYFAKYLVSNNVEFELEGEKGYKYVNVPQTIAFVNAGPAFIATYLRVTLTALANNTKMKFQTKIGVPEDFDKLKKMTLVSCSYNFVELKDGKGVPSDPAQVFKNYLYKYICLPPNEINEYMLSSKDNFYFFTENKKEATPYLAIYDFSEGKIIFQGSDKS